MSKDSKIDLVRKGVRAVIDYDEESLRSRPEWGTINFEEAREDFDRIFSICGYLAELPVERLTEQVVASIHQQLSQVVALFNEINEYSIESGNPTQRRDELISQVHQRAEELSSVASPWIPFLAYERGDVAKNIQLLQGAVEEARQLLEAGRARVKEQQEEIGQAVVAAREASAAAGAAVFTQDFGETAEALGQRARTWLWITGGLAGATLAAAVLFLFVPPTGSTVFDAIHSGGIRLTILGVLAGATVWAGRIYRALSHQETVNQHRSLSLRTFQAFSRAASDDATRDAVLIEATRAVFGASSSGYLNGEPENSGSLHVVELARRLVSKEE